MSYTTRYSMAEDGQATYGQFNMSTITEGHDEDNHIYNVNGGISRNNSSLQPTLYNRMRKWYKLHWFGKLVASILQYSIIGDVLSDIVVIWKVWEYGEHWWALFLAASVYTGLRFTLLFTLTFEKGLLDLEDSGWKTSKLLFKVWDCLHGGDGDIWEVNSVKFSIRTLLGLFVPGVWHFLWMIRAIRKEALDFSCGGILFSFLGILVAVFYEVILVPLYVAIFGPILLVSHMVRGIKFIWESNTISFYENSLEAQTVIFYLTVMVLYEAVAESVPQFLLQTWILVTIDNAIPVSIYVFSTAFSVINIIKAIIICVLMGKKLRMTTYRLVNEITDEYMFALLLDHREDITMLNMQEKGEKMIVQMLLNYPNVRDVDLSKSEITDNGIELAFSNLSDLKHLNLNYTKISDEGLINLAVNCPQLQGLKLSATNITNDGLRIIAGSCKQLRTLDLSNTKITDYGLSWLATNCTRLHYLNLSATNVTDVGASSLLMMCRQMRELILPHQRLKGDDIWKTYKVDYPNIDGIW